MVSLLYAILMLKTAHIVKKTIMCHLLFWVIICKT